MKLTINIPDELHSRLKVLARRYGHNLNGQVIACLKSDIEDSEDFWYYLGTRDDIEAIIKSNRNPTTPNGAVSASEGVEIQNILEKVSKHKGYMTGSNFMIKWQAQRAVKFFAAWSVRLKKKMPNASMLALEWAAWFEREFNKGDLILKDPTNKKPFYDPFSLTL